MYACVNETAISDCIGCKTYKTSAIALMNVCHFKFYVAGLFGLDVERNNRFQFFFISILRKIQHHLFRPFTIHFNLPTLIFLKFIRMESHSCCNGLVACLINSISSTSRKKTIVFWTFNYYPISFLGCINIYLSFSHSYLMLYINVERCVRCVTCLH